MNYRNRALLNLAHKVQECQVRIPGVCTGYSVEGCEPAHSNWSEHGRGMGHKSADIHAAACHACHAAIDSGSKLSRQDKQSFWKSGFERTMIVYLENGWIKVA